MSKPWTPNEEFFRRLGRLPLVIAMTRAAAARSMAAAIASAPVDTGEYKSKIRLERVDTNRIVMFRVVADSEHALVVESRTGNLARSVRAGGAR